MSSDNSLPDFTVIGAWLPYRLHDAAARLGTILFGYYSRKHGLSKPAWKTIAALAAKPDLSGGDIARFSGIDLCAISRAITQLQQRGLIDRRASTHDKRFISVSLTQAGEEMFQDILDVALRIEADMFGSLSQAEVESLDQIVTHLEKTGAQVEARGWQAYADGSDTPQNPQSMELTT